MSMEKHDLIKDFYGNRYNEDGRMARRPLEFLRCKEILSSYLTRDGMEIADIGGATGSFSYWLTRMGHAVHLLDYTPLHIEQAKENGAKNGLALASYTCGDARELPYRDRQFDLALVMGPLYHLQDRADRLRCLLEAKRVLKDGGLVICEAISRYANLFEGFQCNLVDDERFIGILNENLTTGKHTPGDTPYFTTAYFHMADELAGELEEAGFAEIALVPVEGFASAFDANAYLENEQSAELLLKYIRETENIRELFGVSGHFIAVGKKS